MQGWRKYMEDAHICLKNIGDDVALFGIFDGHGGILLWCVKNKSLPLQIGQEVALYVKKHLPDAIKGSLAFKAKNYKQALIEGFLSIDKQLEKKEGKKELQALFASSPRKAIAKEEKIEADLLAQFIGCTACVALITRSEIYVANVGDSRAVLCKKGQAVNMSEDHKPALEKEKKRIEKAEGYIEDDRVNGMLNLSRCLGDLEYKQNKKLKQEEQIITAFPDIKIEKITTETEFLILACDGIWDCMTSQGAVDYLRDKLKPVAKMEKSFKISAIIEGMLDSILAKDIEASDGIGCDNMSCMVICFHPVK